MKKVIHEEDGVTVTNIQLDKAVSMLERFNVLKKTVLETADGNVEAALDLLVFGMLARDNLLLAMTKGKPTQLILEAHKFTREEMNKSKETKEAKEGGKTNI